MNPEVVLLRTRRDARRVAHRGEDQVGRADEWQKGGQDHEKAAEVPADVAERPVAPDALQESHEQEHGGRELKRVGRRGAAVQIQPAPSREQLRHADGDDEGGEDRDVLELGQVRAPARPSPDRPGPAARSTRPSARDLLDQSASLRIGPLLQEEQMLSLLQETV